MKSRGYQGTKRHPLGVGIPIEAGYHLAMVMEPTHIETRNVDHWADAIRETYWAQDILPQTEGMFSATLMRRDIGSLKTVEVQATPQEFRRTEQTIRRSPADDLTLCMVTDGQAVLLQDERSCVLNPGEFSFVESTRPYSFLLSRPSRVVDFAWPQDSIALSESESRAVTARAITTASAMGRWLSPLLCGLFETASGLSDVGVRRLADGVGSLLLMAALETCELPEPAERARRQYDEMLTYIERNLDDPDLTADSLAQAFFVSTRTAHRLFATFGTPVTAVIRDRRLEACRQLLVSSSYNEKSIAFIASEFGFSSAAVFSRAFTAKYGVSPMKYRRTAS